MPDKVRIDLSVFPTLRKCQKESLSAIQNWIIKKLSNNYLICMPTGTGKTGVIALCSTMMIKEDVLIVTPWDSLRTQMVDDIKEKFWHNSKINKPDNYAVVPFSGKDLKKKLGRAKTKTIWVTTFQGLLTISQTYELYKSIQERIGIVIIDEGHYEPAIWWGRSVKALKKRTLLFTATPYRNDLKYFRIDKHSFYHYKYKKGVTDSIIRKVEVEPLNEEDPLSIESIAQAIASKWSTKEKKQYASRKPRLIVCCKNFHEVLSYTVELRKLGLNAIGIHYRANKKNISPKQRPYFFNKVPPKPALIEADVWVHEKMLTEGLDYPPFCVLILTWSMKNDRRLIQQIGRIVRRDSRDKNHIANVFEIKGIEAKDTWNTFLDFEDHFNFVTPEHYRIFLKDYLKNQPLLEYFGGRFRKRLNPNEMTSLISSKTILTLPSVITRVINDKFNYELFVDEITDALQIEDFITIGPEIDSPVVNHNGTDSHRSVLWLYQRFSNSRTLLSHSVYEVKISALCVVIIPPFLFLSDTDSFIPSETLDSFTDSINISYLYRAFSVGYIPFHVQLKNTLPHQSVIRGTVRNGPNLTQVPISISESKYVCRAVRGRKENEGRRYISFRTSRISDEQPGIKREEMCLQDLIVWCQKLARTLNLEQVDNKYFNRYARVIDFAGEAIPMYGFLDFWSGDFKLVDDENNLLEPVDAVFEFELSDEELTKPNSYFFKISGTNDGILKTATISVSYKSGLFTFSTIESDGLSIKENKGTNGLDNFTDIASFLSRKHGDLFISLKNSNLIYNSGTYYEVDPGNNYKDIADYFHPLPELNKPNLTEKNPRSDKKRSTKWLKGTLFEIMSSKSVLEREFNYAPDIVICDDGANEIADFVVAKLNPPKIALIHCKSKPRIDVEKEFRAIAELQEVISQASKNLGYLSGRSDYPFHIDDWQKGSLVDGFNVQRIVKKEKSLPTGQKLWSLLQSDILLNRNSIKEVWIVTGGTISKNWIEDELEKCSTAESNLSCLFHMLDGLGASCIEANAKLRVYCNSLPTPN